MEYCDQGTLEKVSERYFERGMYVPEAFLWEVLEGLAAAARHCHDGPKGLEGEHLGFWDPVYHRDIILTNVFLAKTSHSSYPMVKLGDFGCSVTRSDMDSGAVLKEDLPAEDNRYIPPEGPVASAAADIFQIGLVVFCFYMGSKVPYEPRRGGQARDVCKFYKNEKTPGFRIYSPELRYLIARCVREAPGRRPSAEDLLCIIGKAKARLTRSAHLRLVPLL